MTEKYETDALVIDLRDCDQALAIEEDQRRISVAGIGSGTKVITSPTVVLPESEATIAARGLTAIRVRRSFARVARRVDLDQGETGGEGYG